MIRTRLAAIAAGILLACVGTTAAHASTQVNHPSIYMSNNGHNPGTLTISCDDHVLTVHTVLWADLSNEDQTVKVYREDTNAVVFGPVDILAGGHTPATFPYIAGIAYNAVAIPTVDPWPTTVADLIGRLSASPPTADNSQLLPSMMPTPPTGCLPPNPCRTPALDAVAVTPTCPPCPTPEMRDAVVAPVPTCIPVTSEPSHKPTSTKPPTTTPSTRTTSSPATSTSTPATGSPSPTSSQPAPTPTPTPTSGPTSAAATPPLAHTGASVAPYAIGAVMLLAAGSGFVAYSRRARRR